MLGCEDTDLEGFEPTLGLETLHPRLLMPDGVAKGYSTCAHVTIVLLVGASTVPKSMYQYILPYPSTHRFNMTHFLFLL
jgi:hypothetical protein